MVELVDQSNVITLFLGICTSPVSVTCKFARLDLYYVFRGVLLGRTNMNTLPAYLGMDVVRAVN